jgi:uncharacterized membrane protein YfcA
MGIDILQLALIWAAVLFASILRAFTGFGFALAAVPVFSLFLPPVDAVVLSAALALALGVFSLRSYWGVIGLRQLAPLVSMAVLGTLVGAALLTGMPVALFRLCVGVSVLAACVGVGMARNAGTAAHPLLDWGAGLVSGLMNGMMAIPGPPIIVYALLTESEPRRSRALMMGFFSISAVLALASYAMHGLVAAYLIIYFLLAAPVLYAGDRLGARLFQRYGDDFYRRVAIIMLFALGVVILLRALL